ncbi:MAG: twin-arginine translocation signal domain-containing protein [Aigarchaeota archaeon]|nr:twin-arginine translocation signal domain-containing protein [Candidatus Wolframiiraptor gerlachensis]
MPGGISRRRFMKLLGGAAAAIGLASLGYSLGCFSAGERATLGRSVSGKYFTTLERPLVSLVKGRDVDAMVRRAIEAIGGVEALVSPDSKVLIKSNVGFNRLRP